MAKYLAVFEIFTPIGQGVHNMDYTGAGKPTIETVRRLEAIMRERTGARTAVLINIIELGED